MSDEQISLAETAARKQPLRIRFTVVMESTDLETIKRFLPKFPGGRIVPTRGGYLLAVPKDDDDDGY